MDGKGKANMKGFMKGVGGYSVRGKFPLPEGWVKEMRCISKE
jgi:hypothetical protein